MAKNIYVGNLVWDATADDLLALFQQFGADHLDLLDLTDAGPVATDRWVFPAGVGRVAPEGVGVDDILGRELAVRGRLRNAELVVLADELGPEVSACAPAYAVAVLAAERRP